MPERKRNQPIPTNATLADLLTALELRQEIKQLAKEQRIPASQVVTLALARFLREYASGEVDLNAYKRPSRSPRYDWALEIPSALFPNKKKKKARFFKVIQSR
jgi:hypothetical protein